MKVIISGQNFDTKNLEPTADDVGGGARERGRAGGFRRIP